MDHALAYVLGPEGNSVAELGAVLGWMAIGALGLVVIAAGYRLVLSPPTPQRSASVRDARASTWWRLEV